jgi:hypothetical protein
MDWNWVCIALYLTFGTPGMPQMDTPLATFLVGKQPQKTSFTPWQVEILWPDLPSVLIKLPQKGDSSKKSPQKRDCLE